MDQLSGQMGLLPRWHTFSNRTNAVGPSKTVQYRADILCCYNIYTLLLFAPTRPFRSLGRTQPVGVSAAKRLWNFGRLSFSRYLVGGTRGLSPGSACPAVEPHTRVFLLHGRESYLHRAPEFPWITFVYVGTMWNTFARNDLGTCSDFSTIFQKHSHLNGRRNQNAAHAPRERSVPKRSIPFWIETLDWFFVVRCKNKNHNNRQVRYYNRRDIIYKQIESWIGADSFKRKMCMVEQRRGYGFWFWFIPFEYSVTLESGRPSGLSFGAVISQFDSTFEQTCLHPLQFTQ